LTRDLKNSAGQPSSRRVLSEAGLVALSLALVIAVSVCWFCLRGYTLYYGDAQAHLNIAREVLDSRTPGYHHLGTVWLPLLHLLCVPFVGNNWLWSTGLAGSIPVAACFVVAGTCFYLAARQVYESALAAAVAILCLALNPNILYLASIPMTEQVFLAGLAVLLLALVRFRSTQLRRYLALGVGALWAMCLTRYDGWFLIPFAALWFAGYAEFGKPRTALTVAFFASLAPLYWLAHCWWLTGNALDFYNGPYSALAIQGGKPYPGFHNWREALLYYGDAAKLCAGWPLLIIGAIGCACALATERFSALGFLCLTPLFYLWSMHSSGNPVYGPRYFNSYYNTRYASAVVVAAAFASGAIIAILPVTRRNLALVLPFLAIIPWIANPSQENWICWKESQVNSISRREWTAEGAAYFKRAYLLGEGVLASSGDVTGVFCKAGIPLRETLNIADVPVWYGASARPNLAYDTGWAIAQDGDRLSKSLRATPQAFELIQTIQVKGAPALNVYRRRARLD
jgi:hypothetical protein